MIYGLGDGHFDENGGGHHHLHISHLQPAPQKRTASEPPRPPPSLGVQEVAARRAPSPSVITTDNSSSEPNQPIASANLPTIQEQQAPLPANPSPHPPESVPSVIVAEEAANN